MNPSRSFSGLVVVVGIAALLVGLAAGFGGAILASSPSTTSAPFTVTETATATDVVTYTPTPTAPPGPATTISEGTWLVGKDIQPGTYRTSGSSGSTDCYWQRMSGTGGGMSDVVANELTNGPSIVTIDPSDVAFMTKGCETWTLVP